MSQCPRSRLAAFGFSLRLGSGALFSALTLTAPMAAPAHVRAAQASEPAALLAGWVIASDDNQGLPFVIVDKVRAQVFVFRADGRLRGSASVLLGLARGDDEAPGIAQRGLSGIRPSERTTPAGRFLAETGYDTEGKDVVWLDYDIGLALHRVITSDPKERRLQRLASRSPQDKRISYGCINVPARFFDRVVKPAFAGRTGVVYVLPEVKPLRAVFPAAVAYAAAAKVGAQPTVRTLE